jgi:hypothetical protein
LNDDHQRKIIDFILSGRGEPDAQDLEDLQVWIEDLTERREALSRTLFSRTLNRSEIARLDKDLGYARYVEPVLTEKTRVMVSHQGRKPQREAEATAPEERWWADRETSSGTPAREEAVREHEPVERFAQMTPTEREIDQAKLLVEDAWWRSDTPADDAPPDDLERERDRYAR